MNRTSLPRKAWAVVLSIALALSMSPSFAWATSIPDDMYLDIRAGGEFVIPSGTTLTVPELADAVAKLEHADGTVQYATQDSFDSLSYQDGDTLVLLDDVEGTLSFDCSVTVDLGGHVFWSRYRSTAPAISFDGCSGVIKNGYVRPDGPADSGLFVANGMVTIEQDAVIEAYHSLGVRLGEKGGLNVYGDVVGRFDYCAISGSGSGDADGTTIIINDGALVRCDERTAIYHPQVGVVDVRGGDVVGSTAIEMRAGDLKVSGSSVVFSNLPVFRAVPNENGPTTQGAGIAVVQHSAARPINVVVEGGAITGRVPLYEANLQNNSEEAIDQIKLSISGGVFDCKFYGTDAVQSEDCTSFITGGTFNTVLDERLFDSARYMQNPLDDETGFGEVVARSFEVKYDLDGGSLPEGVQNPTTYTTLDEFSLANPVRPGYLFAGWEGTDLDAPTVDVSVAKGAAGPRSYRATWTSLSDIAYSVEYYYQDAGAYPVQPTQTVRRTGTAGAVAAVTDADKVAQRPGYVFDAAASNIESGVVAIDGSLTLKVYFKQQFTVTYDPGSHAAAGSAPLVVESLDYGARLPLAPTLHPAEDYRFAGWGAELPATVTSDVRFTAQWTRGVVVSDGPVTILVDMPDKAGDAVSATVADEALEAVVAHAREALKTLREGKAPAGMTEEDARRVTAALNDARDEVTIRMTVHANAIDGAVPPADSDAIDRLKADHEQALAYFDFSVTMEVQVRTADTGEVVSYTVPVTEVDHPLLIALRTAPEAIAGKSVRVARVHEGVAEIVGLESVDRAQGAASFYADRFSTYALLVSSSVAVTFDAQGGSFASGSQLVQTVPYGAEVERPVDPTREGYAFVGWFVDEGLTQAYDFSKPAESPFTLYAGWKKLAGPAVESPHVQPPSTTPTGALPHAQAAPGASPTPAAVAALAPTGDAAGATAALAFALALAAGVAAALAARRARWGIAGFHS